MNFRLYSRNNGSSRAAGLQPAPNLSAVGIPLRPSFKFEEWYVPKELLKYPAGTKPSAEFPKPEKRLK